MGERLVAAPSRCESDNNGIAGPPLVLVILAWASFSSHPDSESNHWTKAFLRPACIFLKSLVPQMGGYIVNESQCRRSFLGFVSEFGRVISWSSTHLAWVHLACSRGLNLEWCIHCHCTHVALNFGLVVAGVKARIFSLVCLNSLFLLHLHFPAIFGAEPLPGLGLVSRNHVSSWLLHQCPGPCLLSWIVLFLLLLWFDFPLCACSICSELWSWLCTQRTTNKRASWLMHLFWRVGKPEALLLQNSYHRSYHVFPDRLYAVVKKPGWPRLLNSQTVGRFCGGQVPRIWFSSSDIWQILCYC